MNENDVARQVVDAAYQIHTQIGPGLLESAYHALMVYELTQRGLRVECEVPVPVVYKGVRLEIGFRADMIVEDLLVIELKSVEALALVHHKQLLTYLRMTGKKLGLLINFGAPRIKDGIQRIANGL